MHKKKKKKKHHIFFIKTIKCDTSFYKDTSTEQDIETILTYHCFNWEYNMPINILFIKIIYKYMYIQKHVIQKYMVCEFYIKIIYKKYVYSKSTLEHP